MSSEWESTLTVKVKAKVVAGLHITHVSASPIKPGCETELRAEIVDRFLGEVGRAEIPVLAGKATPKTPMSQRRYAEGGHFAKNSHGDAAGFLLAQIQKYPGEITLIAS